jgi:hypothetical protein
MKEDRVAFSDKIGAIEYITKHADFGRIEVTVVTKQQVEKEKRILELYSDDSWDWGCYKG